MEAGHERPAAHLRNQQPLSLGRARARGLGRAARRQAPAPRPPPVGAGAGEAGHSSGADPTADRRAHALDARAGGSRSFGRGDQRVDLGRPDGPRSRRHRRRGAPSGRGLLLAPAIDVRPDPRLAPGQRRRARLLAPADPPLPSSAGGGLEAGPPGPAGDRLPARATPRAARGALDLHHRCEHLADGVVDRGEGTRPGARLAARRDGRRGAALDPGPRAGPRPAPGSPGPLAGVAGLRVLLVEPRGLVGAAQPEGYGGGLLRRPGPLPSEARSPFVRELAAERGRAHRLPGAPPAGRGERDEQRRIPRAEAPNDHIEETPPRHAALAAVGGPRPRRGRPSPERGLRAGLQRGRAAPGRSGRGRRDHAGPGQGHDGRATPRSGRRGRFQARSRGAQAALFHARAPGEGRRRAR